MVSPKSVKKFKTTKDIKTSPSTVNQIVGQEEAVDIIKKAARQRRNVLLIGEPGTGKSLTGQALAELIPKGELDDILSFDNPSDEHSPIIRIFPRGEGKTHVNKFKIESLKQFKGQMIFFYILIAISIFSPWWVRKQYGDIMAAASLISSMMFIAIFILFLNLNKKTRKGIKVPKMLIDNSRKEKAPFIDATGSHAGALLGDVLHDPLQSGGLGTPAYERLVPGMIHKANKGVLFIDEVGNMDPATQQEILTCMQERKYPITGQSERSSGAMVRSEEAPTDFILVAAGTPDTIKRMNPALRSRIRGYGYEINMNHSMDDTIENQYKLAVFIAQEVKKDKKIPHFTKDAVEAIIQEARIRSGTSKKLTLRLRELGGLVRAAGDLALEQDSKYVQSKHVINAKKFARTLEQQIVDKYIENKKKYEVIVTTGSRVGRVNGLAVMGSDSYFSGLVLPIESEVTPGGKRSDFIATGKLGEIAKEAVQNVSAIILKYFGEDIKEKYDIFIQFLQTASESGGVEGDSASIAVATAIISALKKVPIKQGVAMTGSLSVRGEVLAVGGITQKIEAAIQAGIKKVIIPKSNANDIILSPEDKKKVKIVLADKLETVLEEALEWKGHEALLRKIKKVK
ncbi:ATP-dependent protease LonB [Candidatus Woesearchaeota archaeon]|jgi:ATP-dependent Lon protease|nr:ATP-dependent protease LonB [Candidatus Woesearchaeota archaeon]